MMSKRVIFLTVTFLMASFLTGCATSFVNTESKPSTRQTNYDKMPFL